MRGFAHAQGGAERPARFEVISTLGARFFEMCEQFFIDVLVHLR
jgi:hypothetical protein